MKIIGFNLHKISAQRKNPLKGKLEIKSNIDIKDIQKEEIDISDKQALKFEFDFIIEYNPKFASVEINGSVLVLDDKNEGKEILKDWKKKKFAHEIKVPLFNFIMDKCNLKALMIEEELNLPHHIPLPKLKMQDQNNSPANYAG